MDGRHSLPTIDTAKTQAKRLRAGLEDTGCSINHSKSLELLSTLYGYKDWNTLNAAINKDQQSCPFYFEQRITGQYLGHSFSGEIYGIRKLSTPGMYRVSVRFDEPIDVVASESFSNFRTHVNAVIGTDGRALDKTSDGKPVLVVEV